jgi:hypothetical protein
MLWIVASLLFGNTLLMFLLDYGRKHADSGRLAVLIQLESTNFRHFYAVITCVLMADDFQDRDAVRKRWSACPNCSVDLGIKPLGSKPPYRECPHCKALLSPVWWQRCVWVAVSLFLTFAVPAALGIRGLMGLLLAGLICEWPALAYGFWTRVGRAYCQLDDWTRRSPSTNDGAESAAPWNIESRRVPAHSDR